MSNTERLLITGGSILAMLIFGGAAAYCAVTGNEQGAGTCAMLASLSGFGALMTRLAGNGNAPKLLFMGAIGVASAIGLGACGTTPPACTVYDAVHRTACHLCESTAEPCPFASEESGE